MARYLLALMAIAALYAPCIAADYYISPTGNNAGNGAIGAPWATFDYAIDQLNPGDTLHVRGGTYALNSRIQIRSDEGGTESAPIRIWAYENESPVLNFATMSNSQWGQSAGRGIQVDDGADWLHLRGLTIENARDNGIWSGANHGVYERIVTRWNGDSGMQLSGFASYNLIQNADSYENYDPSGNGENADGFAIKFTDLGPGNVVRGARAWGNADDGWDMWQSIQGAVLVEDSWAFDNGKILPRFYTVEALEANDMTPSNFGGDGNGFKLGQDSGPHVLNRVLAWDNQVRGVDSNGNRYGVFVNNSTVYDSGRNWDFDETDAQTTEQHILTNNVSFAGSQSDLFYSGVESDSNTWNGIPVNAADFLSLDDTIARGPRQADGSLPVSDYLRLAPDSNLIDAGKNLGMPFSGLAPDLGAFESGLFGDYNSDGVVNAADYTVWRDNIGGGFLPPDYGVWTTHYGEGAAAGLSVPEPTGATFVLMTLLLSRRRFRPSSN
jgi:hypothetical protein